MSFVFVELIHQVPQKRMRPNQKSRNLTRRKRRRVNPRKENIIKRRKRREKEREILHLPIAQILLAMTENLA